MKYEITKYMQFGLAFGGAKPTSYEICSIGVWWYQTYGKLYNVVGLASPNKK